MLDIALVLPCGDFVAEGLLIGNAAVEALDGEDAEFGFTLIVRWMPPDPNDRSKVIEQEPD